MTISTTNRRAIVACLSMGALASLVGLTNAQVQAKPRRATTVATQNTDANNQSQTNNQNANQNNRDNRTDRMNHRFAANDRMDECFAKSLIMANENEIRGCQIAQEKGSAPVKQFAQTMQQQHQDFLAKLQAFDKAHSKGPANHSAAYRFNLKKNSTDNNTNNTTPPQNNVPPQNNAPSNQQQTTIQQTAGVNTNQAPNDANPANKEHDPFFHHMGQIHKELADQCRQSMEKELASKTGAEFDACFVGMQIAAHMHMLDTLTVFERHASPELKTLITAGKQTTQTHLDHAKSLMKSLPKDHSANPNVNNANPGNK